MTPIRIRMATWTALCFLLLGAAASVAIMAWYAPDVHDDIVADE